MDSQEYKQRGNEVQANTNIVKSRFGPVNLLETFQQHLMSVDRAGRAIPTIGTTKRFCFYGFTRGLVMENKTFSGNDILLWRQQLIRRILPIISGLGLLAVIATIYTNVSSRTVNWVLFVELLAYGLVLLITFWKRAPYALQAGLLLLVFYGLGTLNLINGGMSSDGSMLLLAFATAVMIFFGWRAGVGAIIFSAFQLLFFGWAYSSGMLSVPVAQFLRSNGTFSSWASTVVIYSLLANFLVLSQNHILVRLVHALEISQEAKNAVDRSVLMERDQRKHLQTIVEKYVAYMAQVGQGDLAKQLEVTQIAGEDELLVQLGQQLNNTTVSLSAMIHQIRESAQNLTTATTEILAATTQQASGASEQSAAISQTTTTVEQVKGITEQAALRAQEVVTASQRTVEVASSGTQAVRDTILSMNDIRERVESIAENILALSEQTQQIRGIIETVGDIAAQSNLLALNAAVEAARAGEGGRGFAVVAAEVRSLAEQSRQATVQVKEIIAQIQKATNSTVMATEEGTKGVERGVSLAAKAREAIEQLASVITESAQTATQVLAGSQQQRTGVDQIAMAMQNINQATAQNLASTRQAGQSAENLNDLAQRMNQLVQQYQCE